MGEPRLIDANHIVEVAQHAYNEWNLAMATQDTNRGVNKVLKMQELCKCVEAVANDAPTIDLETLPIVKELRDKLKNAEEERNKYKKYLDIATQNIADLTGKILIAEKERDEAREAICTHCQDVPCQKESCYWFNMKGE